MENDSLSLFSKVAVDKSTAIVDEINTKINSYVIFFIIQLRKIN